MKTLTTLLLLPLMSVADQQSPALGLVPFPAIDPAEQNPGGQTTHQKRLNKNAFSYPSANMAFERELDFKVGNGFFKRVCGSPLPHQPRQPMVSAQSTTPAPVSAAT
jgi:CxxC motif-containing protein (DUF1111 family)